MTVTHDQSSARRLSRAARSYSSSLWARREFAWYMAMGNLRSRNASTALGLVWWIVNPMMMGAVYYLVFGVILGISRDLSYLLSGVFVFYFSSTSITTGANSIIQNRALLVNLQFPRLVMPITAVIETGVGFLASIPALYLIIWPTQGVAPTLQLVYLLPVIFTAHAAFNLGLAALTARVTVPFRDVTNVIPHLLRIWFYLSPILYSIDQFEDPPDWAVNLYGLNPMVPLMSVYRSALLGWPVDTAHLVQALVWAGVIFVVAITVFIKYEGKMARYL